MTHCRYSHSPASVQTISESESKRAQIKRSGGAAIMWTTAPPEVLESDC